MIPPMHLCPNEYSVCFQVNKLVWFQKVFRVVARQVLINPQAFQISCFLISSIPQLF